MKKSILTLGLVLVAGVAFASNTGFKLNYPLIINTAGSGENWISVPFFYFPNGNVGQTPQSAEDLCRDLNSPTPKDASNVTQVIRFDTTSDAPIAKSCTATAALFNLNVGEGYSVKGKSTGRLQIDIVGSHDDRYAPNKNNGTPQLTHPLIYNSAGSNVNLISVPYHSIANNSEDLCRALNSPTPKDASRITQVIRFDTATDAPIAKSCTATASLFNLVPGEGYGAKPKTSATAALGVAVDVY
jgi:hypothetical protein